MSYEMWLNYDNDSKTFQFPVLPESIKVEMAGKDITFNIDQIGEIFHKSKRNALKISFSSFFPSEYGRWCQVTESRFKLPAESHKWITQIMDAENPAHFVLTGGPMPINCYVLVTNYTPEEVGGDPGTIQYSIKMKEYRSTSIRTIRNSKADSSKKVVKTETNKRVSNKEKSKTYTIKNGDNLWNIAKKYYGDPSKYTKILSANRETLDKVARKYGNSSCNNGNLIFAGTVIKIPA